MRSKHALRFVLFLLVLWSSQFVMAEEARLKPFSLAQNVKGISLAKMAERVRNQLSREGFQVVGAYSPYPQSKIFVITTRQLKSIAARTRLGGFGAVLKVSLVDNGKSIQISYNNPHYLGLAYNMGDKLDGIKRKLDHAIGFIKDFGGGEGIEADKLSDYNYTFGLEGFDGYMDLAEFRSFEQAIRKVESGLKKGRFGIKKVFRVDVPGKKQVLFGLSMQADTFKQPFLNDEYVMKIIDHKILKRLPHLPYELLVDGNKVIALHPHFRLAINFPEMHMFGEHSFGKLMDLPYAYEEYIIKSVGGEWPPPEQDW